MYIVQTKWNEFIDEKPFECGGNMWLFNGLEYGVLGVYRLKVVLLLLFGSANIADFLLFLFLFPKQYLLISIIIFNVKCVLSFIICNVNTTIKYQN